MGMGPLPKQCATSIYCNANSVTRVNGTPIYFETCPTPIYLLLTILSIQRFRAPPPHAPPRACISPAAGGRRAALPIIITTITIIVINIDNIIITIIINSSIINSIIIIIIIIINSTVIDSIILDVRLGLRSEPPGWVGGVDSNIYIYIYM